MTTSIEVSVTWAQAGKVIKAFAFRGSMHYLSPEDGGIYLALRSAGRQWELPSWVEYYRLAASDWPDFRAAVRAALSDGSLTLVELGAERWEGVVDQSTHGSSDCLGNPGRARGQVLSAKVVAAQDERPPTRPRSARYRIG